MSRTPEQERLLWEAVAANTNSLNLIANEIARLKEVLDTIYWRQDTEIQRWRSHAAQSPGWLAHQGATVTDLPEFQRADD